MDIDVFDDGAPSWADVSSPDPEAARAFYSALFGWEVHEGPAEAGGYSIALLRGRAVAGIGPQMTAGPAVWSCYVNVRDADEVVARAVANGGRVVMGPVDVLDVGRVAFVADPTGAAIGLWQAGARSGAGIMQEPGALGWIELLTDDVAGAIEFYGKVFGWQAQSHGGLGQGGYTEFSLGGQPVAGTMVRPPTMPAHVSPYWGVYLGVADANTAASRVLELGGHVMLGPLDIEPGRFAVVSDPGGAVFNIIAMKAG